MNIGGKKELIKEKEQGICIPCTFPLQLACITAYGKMSKSPLHFFFHYREIKEYSLKFNFIMFKFLIMGYYFTGREANLLEILSLGTNNKYKESNFVARHLCYHFQIDSKELIM